MDDIEFADGFDRPDTIAFGLGAAQVAVVMAGALAAYSLVRSPLPPAVAEPAALLFAVTAAGLGWLRIAGRPALDWAIFAGRFWIRPRHGRARWELATANAVDDAADNAIATAGGDCRRADTDDDHPAAIVELFGERRASSPWPGNGQTSS